MAHRAASRAIAAGRAKKRRIGWKAPERSRRASKRPIPEHDRQRQKKPELPGRGTALVVIEQLEANQGRGVGRGVGARVACGVAWAVAGVDPRVGLAAAVGMTVGGTVGCGVGVAGGLRLTISGGDSWGLAKLSKARRRRR